MAKTKVRLRKPYRIALYVIIALLILGIGSLIIISESKKAAQPVYVEPLGEIKDVKVSDDKYGIFATPDDEIKCTLLLVNCGQAQSILIDNGEYEVLIDAGCYNDGDTTVVNTIKPYIDGDLEYAIATHCHEDHIGGFTSVFDAFKVQKVIYGDLCDEAYCNIFKDHAIAEVGAENFSDKADFTINLGSETTLTLYHKSLGNEDPNANSIVALLTCGKTKFFMSGDLEQNEENLYRGMEEFEKVDVVIAGHHGSNTSNTLINDILKPKYILVSCGANNDYHHPHKSFLESIKKYRAYATYKSGTIVVNTDGKSVDVLNLAGEKLPYKEALSVDDAGAIVKIDNEKGE